jgi:hypothetical protein
LTIQNTVSPESNDHGIIFNYKQQVLIAEKYENVKFLVPYPQYNLSIAVVLQNISTRLEQLMEVPLKNCDFKLINTDETSFKTDGS